MKFFDRTQQLAELREIKKRTEDNHSMLTVVTGRRRIGKTTLIDKAMDGEPYLYFFVGKKNEAMIEIGQFPLLARVMSDDYSTYSGDTLERYFRATLAESLKYREIGSWWNPGGYTDSKGNHQQGEIDIVAVSADDKSVDIIEVKRSPDKYDAKLLKEKVEFFARKESRLGRYRKTLRCLSLKDM